MDHTGQYLDDAAAILGRLDRAAIEAVTAILLDVRAKAGRLFLIGVGGSAANAAHAVNDFRKLAGMEAYSPADNVAELTARTNDEGWHTVFAAWLRTSRIRAEDCVFVLSVGGGDRERNVSANIVEALDVARAAGARIVGVVGRAGGYTAKVADACVIVPTVNEATVTPHTESFQALIWHLIVSDPRMMQIRNKWESLAGATG